MLREMIQCFFDEVDNSFPQMRAALEKGDLKEVGRLGHRMKGTIVYLGAEPAKHAALHVERFCKSSDGTPSEAENAINALEHECIALKAALSIRWQPNQCRTTPIGRRGIAATRNARGHVRRATGAYPPKTAQEAEYGMKPYGTGLLRPPAQNLPPASLPPESSMPATEFRPHFSAQR